MSNQDNQNSQPIIISEEPFIVKVKLLTNEVYEINTAPNTTVADLKKLIQVKTQVPIERQRLVFGGKQLVDNNPISQYVKESGNTIHLIARAQTAESTQNTQQQQPQQPQTPPPQQQQVPPQFRPAQGLPPPFGGLFSMMGSPQPGMMNNPPQSSGQQQNPNQFAQNINNAVSTLMGNLGIRVIPGPINLQNPQPPQNIFQPQQPQSQPPQQPQQQPQQAQRSQSPNQQQSQPQQNQPRPPIPPSNQFNFNYRALEQLQQNMSRINLPLQIVNPNLNPREHAVQYLRRLQNNLLRFIPQLNRGVQLLQEGRTSHLSEFVNIFQSLNISNNGAIEIIRALNQNQPQHHNHNQCNNPNHNHGNIPNPNQVNPQNVQQNQPQSQPQQGQQQPSNNVMQNEADELSTTIIIAQDQNNQGNGSMSIEITNNNPQQQEGQGTQNIMGVLNNFLQPGAGFNFANLFAPQRTEPQQPPSNVQPNTQNSQTQPNQPSQNVPSSQNSANNPQVPPQNPQPNQSSEPQQQNPMAGMMSMFNNLQQSGGMGTLLGMSIGSMLQEQGQPTTVYSAILAPVTGSEILACFTQKDFSFISKKRLQFREATLKAISVAGSRQDLVDKYASDVQNLFIPQGSVRNEEVCRKRVAKILHRHLEKVIGYFLDTSPELKLTESVISQIKAMYCEAIEEIAKHSESIDNVFLNIKRGFIQSFDQMIPGFSGMLYAIIEKDLVRIYREYIDEKKRRQEMSEEQAKDEADLLKKIEQEGKQDVEDMAGFEHSKFYPQSK